MIGLGYSNGANILASVMLEQPDLFDEAILMHPLVPWTPAPQIGLAGKRVLITGRPARYNLPAGHDPRPLPII